MKERGKFPQVQTDFTGCSLGSRFIKKKLDRSRRDSPERSLGEAVPLNSERTSMLKQELHIPDRADDEDEKRLNYGIFCVG